VVYTLDMTQKEWVTVCRYLHNIRKKTQKGDTVVTED